MNRTTEIRQLVDRIRAMGLTDRELVTVTAVLFDGRTHGELAEAEGITRDASRQRLKRARRRARRNGIVLPCPRRSEWRPLSELGRPYIGN